MQYSPLPIRHTVVRHAESQFIVNDQKGYLDGAKVASFCLPCVVVYMVPPVWVARNTGSSTRITASLSLILQICLSESNSSVTDFFVPQQRGANDMVLEGKAASPTRVLNGSTSDPLWCIAALRETDVMVKGFIVSKDALVIIVL
ncbi:hypothetical protein PM082_002286 [Marasmius tenuissimus]|nr:hypothetical protein PM082_002286 [Marasmius tenuissimus]